MSNILGPDPSLEDQNIFETNITPQSEIGELLPFDIPNYVRNLPYPSCAVSINGNILENEVPGYRTIRVEGRDSFSNSIDNYSTKLNPGSRFQRAHEESRNISITFALHGYDYYDIRKRLDKLRSIVLSKSNEEAQIIFADEWDVYYVGTVENLTVEKLVNNQNADGQISIKCSDVRKYKIAPSETLIADQENDYRFDIDYKGIRPAYPHIHVTMPSNNDVDYFGFVNQDGKILQFGTVLSAEDGTIPKPENRINQDFRKTFPSDWKKSQDTPTPNYATVCTDMSTFVQHGEVLRNETSGIYPNSYGTWDPETMEELGAYHGPSTTHSVGVEGAKNWKFTSLLTQWHKEPTTEGINVVLRNDYDVLACVSGGNSDDKMRWDKTIDIGFAAYEGAKQVPCKVKSITQFLNASLVKAQDAKANADGLIRFKMVQGDSVPASSGTVTIVFTVTYSGGTIDKTKTYHWVKNVLQPTVTAQYDIAFRQYEFILDCDSNNKTKQEYVIKAPFGTYNNSTRIAGTIASTTLFGQNPKKEDGTSGVVNATTSADGYIRWVIPQGTTIPDASQRKILSVSITAGGQSQTLQDVLFFVRNHGSEDVMNGASTVKVPLDHSAITLPCLNNKTFADRTFKVEFGGFEGTIRRKCEVTKTEFLGASAKALHATTEQNGWIQWTIPAGTSVTDSEGVVRVTFAVTTAKRGKIIVIREIRWHKEEMTATITDYSQLGGLAIIVAGTRFDNTMQSIAEIQFFKNKTKSTKGVCNIYLDDSKKTSFEYDCIRTNPVTGTNDGKNKTGAIVEIEHIGNDYIFTIGGKKYSFSNSNDLTATEISFFFMRFKGNNTLERNSVKTAKFVKYPDMETVIAEIGSATSYSAAQNAIQNLVYTDDEIDIDCGTGEVMVNGVAKYGYGQLGNDWEDFYLSPGPNSIQCVWDEESSGVPEFSLYYTEVF